MRFVTVALLASSVASFALAPVARGQEGALAVPSGVDVTVYSAAPPEATAELEAKGLKKLELKLCDKVTPAGIDALEKARPDVEIAR